MPLIDLAALMGLPPEAAIKAFEAKGYTLSWDWHETWKEANASAFTVAKLMRLDVLQDIHAAVKTSLTEGETAAWFSRRLTPLMQDKGWWGKKIVVGSDGQAEVVQEGSPRRLQTIFRTNLQTAYAAGRWQAFQDNAADRPFLQYVAVLDGRSRPAHAALNGKVFPIDSPAWQVIAPPNGFNCRCRARALSAHDLQARGLRVEPDAQIETRPVGEMLANRRTGEFDPGKQVQRGVSVPDANRPGKRVTLWADSGWDYNPGAAGVENLLRIATEKTSGATHMLAAQTIRSLVASDEFVAWYQAPQGNFPLISILDSDAALIGARRTTGELSAETAKKQRREHPELTPAEYIEAQSVVDEHTRKFQEGANTLIYVREVNTGEAGGYVLVVKATRTGQGLFVSSYRRMSRDEARRDAEIARLERKAEKK